MIERLSIDITHPQPDLLERACQTLSAGGLVILPTETVYGIACDPSVPGAMERLAAAKARDAGKPIARLAADVKQVSEAALHWSSGLAGLAEQFWPGPLTIVLETSTGWTGFRVPDHAVALALARQCGRLLALTSANPSGEPDTTTAHEAMAAVEADLVLDSGPARGTTPSTVVKVNGDQIECLRAGALPFADIEQVFNGGRTRS